MPRCYPSQHIVLLKGNELKLEEPHKDPNVSHWRWGILAQNSTDINLIGRSERYPNGTVKSHCDISYQFRNRIQSCQAHLTVSKVKVIDSGCYAFLRHGGGLAYTSYFNVTVIHPKPVISPLKKYKDKLTFACKDALNQGFFTEPRFEEHTLFTNLNITRHNDIWTIQPKCKGLYVSLSLYCCTSYPGGDTCGDPAHVFLDSCASGNANTCGQRRGPPTTYNYRNDSIDHPSKSTESCKTTMSSHYFVTGCMGYNITLFSNLSHWDERGQWYVKYPINTDHPRYIGKNNSCIQEKYEDCNRKLTVKNLTPLDKGFYFSKIPGGLDINHLSVSEPLGLNLILVNLGAHTITLSCSYNSRVPVTIKWYVGGFFDCAHQNQIHHDNVNTITLGHQCASKHGHGVKSHFHVYCSGESATWKGTSSVLVFGGHMDKCVRKEGGYSLNQLEDRKNAIDSIRC